MMGSGWRVLEIFPEIQRDKEADHARKRSHGEEPPPSYKGCEQAAEGRTKRPATSDSTEDPSCCLPALIQWIEIVHQR